MSAPLTLELPSNILISGRMLEMIKIFSDLYNPQSDFTFLGGSYSVQRKMGNYLMRLLALKCRGSGYPTLSISQCCVYDECSWWCGLHVFGLKIGKVKSKTCKFKVKINISTKSRGRPCKALYSNSFNVKEQYLVERLVKGLSVKRNIDPTEGKSIT